MCGRRLRVGPARAASEPQWAGQGRDWLRRAAPPGAGGAGVGSAPCLLVSRGFPGS